MNDENSYSKQLLFLEGIFPERDSFNDLYFFHQYIDKFYNKARKIPILRCASTVEDLDLEHIVLNDDEEYYIKSTHIPGSEYLLKHVGQITNCNKWCKTVLETSVTQNPFINLLLKLGLIYSDMYCLNITPRLYIQPVFKKKLNHI